MPKIKIISVQCAVPDEVDKDEMYLKFKNKKVWPIGNLYFRMDTGDKVEVDLELDVDAGWNEIELWDFDYMSLNDHLGTFKFMIDNTSGEFSTSMELFEKNSTASYILNWQVVF